MEKNNVIEIVPTVAKVSKRKIAKIGAVSVGTVVGLVAFALAIRGSKNEDDTVDSTSN